MYFPYSEKKKVYGPIWSHSSKNDLTRNYKNSHDSNWMMKVKVEGFTLIFSRLIKFAHILKRSGLIQHDPPLTVSDSCFKVMWPPALVAHLPKQSIWDAFPLTVLVIGNTIDCIKKMAT